MNTLFILGALELFLIIGMVLLPLLALIDILTGRFEQNDKLVWVLVVIFLNILGAFLYFIIGRRNRKSP